MHSSQLRALAPAHRETVPPEVWERRLRRFPKPWRHRVLAVANEDARLRDLALSFPALLFAIAAPRPAVDMAPAIRAIIAGERLKRIAALAELPMWLRVLPPESFAAPIPALPDSTFFAKQVVNFLPRSAKAMPIWLQAIGESFALADEAHVLWIAREFACGPRSLAKRRRRGGRHRARNYDFTSVRRLCLWAWYSTHAPDLVPEDIRWLPAVGLKAAENSTWKWLTAVDIHLTLGDAPIADTWFEAGTVDGFEFVPLRTAADLVEEARIMRNCVSSYASSLAENRSRLWSVRRDGVRQATLELSRMYGDPLPNVYELGGIENNAVSREISLAARHWMMLHEHVLRDKVWAEETAAKPDVDMWRQQWRAYWIAKRRIPEWLPLAPSHHTTLWAI
jgi:hypothetical protein